MAAPGALTAAIVDAHAHVWDPGTLRYPWLAGHPLLSRAWLPADLDDAAGRVSGWVFVEADAHIEDARTEVEWVAALEWPGLAGIVAHVDLADPALGQALDGFTANPLVRGVRATLQNRPADHLRESAVARGLAAVAASGLVFDACVRADQLDELASALERVPDLPVVIDHLGKPPIAQGVHSEAGAAWELAWRRLAGLPAVQVKCSGFAAEVADHDLLRARVPEFLAVTAGLFGSRRCMFGSDWPVSGADAGGLSTAEAIDIVGAAFAPHEHGAVFGGTARGFYGLSG
jgi:L-fuconolactonase